MSPLRHGSLLDKTTMVNRLAPSMMRAFELTRQQAQETLASLGPVERDLLYRIKGRAFTVKNRRRITNP